MSQGLVNVHMPIPYGREERLHKASALSRIGHVLGSVKLELGFQIDLDRISCSILVVVAL